MCYSHRSHYSTSTQTFGTNSPTQTKDQIQDQINIFSNRKFIDTTYKKNLSEMKFFKNAGAFTCSDPDGEVLNPCVSAVRGESCFDDNEVDNDLGVLQNFPIENNDKVPLCDMSEVVSSVGGSLWVIVVCPGNVFESVITIEVEFLDTVETTSPPQTASFSPLQTWRFSDVPDSIKNQLEKYDSAKKVSAFFVDSEVYKTFRELNVTIDGENKVSRPFENVDRNKVGCLYLRGGISQDMLTDSGNPENFEFDPAKILNIRDFIKIHVMDTCEHVESYKFELEFVSVGLDQTEYHFSQENNAFDISSIPILW